jgi:hypothetical protein
MDIRRSVSFLWFKMLAGFGFLFIACIFGFSPGAAAQDNGLVVVGNLSGPPGSMKMAELKSTMMGEKQRWKDGKRVVIALMKTSTPLGRVISQKIYDMTGDELNKYWLALVFQGKALAPNFFNTPADLEAFVAQNPGAIGILNKSSSSGEVKVILVDGQKTF